MIKLGIIVFFLATRCFPQPFPQATPRSIYEGMDESLNEIREAVVDTTDQLKIFYKYYMSDKNIPEEELQHIIGERAAKIIKSKNLHPKLMIVIYVMLYPALLNHAGFKFAEHFKAWETNVTKVEVRSLLRIMADLRTVLPTNRVYMKATSRTATYLLKSENLIDLFSCFVDPEPDRQYRDTDKISLYEFILLAYPYFVRTFVDLVKEDARLKSEFERPLQSGRETNLFIMTDDQDKWSAPIVPITYVLHQLGDLDNMNNRTYLKLRAMVQVANEGTEEANKLNDIFWHSLGDEDRMIESDYLFDEITERIKANTILWERVRDAEDELDVENVKQKPSMSLQPAE